MARKKKSETPKVTETNQTSIPVETVEEVKADLKATEEVKEVEVVDNTPKLFWVRQIRLKGRTVTGEVLEEDKQEFIALCKKNGVTPNLHKWMVLKDWRAKVYKNYKQVTEKGKK